MPTRAQIVKKSADWLNENFRTAINGAFEGTAFDLKHIYGIAWVESSELWPNLIGKYSVSEILSFCVLDGSGDVSGTSRAVFPRNAAAFRSKYNSNFTDMLIKEGNNARKARGSGPATILYKGYGIFQYDLQFVESDRAFFEEKLWYKFPECLLRLKGEHMNASAKYKDVGKRFGPAMVMGQRLHNTSTTFFNLSTIWRAWSYRKSAYRKIAAKKKQKAHSNASALFHLLPPDTQNPN